MEKDPDTTSQELITPSGIRYKFDSVRFHLARKLLSGWIKPNVLDCDPQTLGISDDSLVCYVLPYRSLTDLLVTDQACETSGLPRPYLPVFDSFDKKNLEHRAIYFLSRPEGFLGRRSSRKHSDRMVRLFDYQEYINQRGEKRSIKIVPVSLFWGHQPDREQSMFKLIFSENWTVTTGFKKLLAGLFHRRHILVQFSSPVLLRDLMSTTENGGNREIQIRKLSRILRVHFRRQKQAILGPDLSHRRTLINSMITSISVRQAIESEAEEQSQPLAKIEKKAQSYAREIVSHQTYRVIRFFYVLLSWLWNRLYDGIEIKGLEKVKELARDHEIVYVPCHRSHVDYLLLSYVLYENGLTPPHIAAGKNLNLPIVGPLLRRAGAFFMRRSFKEDLLYKAVFDEYMHVMLTRGFSIEYFIEGGRSRTGRTLNPRTGMLSMTLNSLLRSSTLPIAIMPVYFGYERILESTTYMNELKGETKKEETVMDIVRVLKILKNNFGRVAVNFGEPVKLQSFLSETHPQWSSPLGISGEKFRGVCSDLAQVLVTKINNAVALNPVNLVATIILATPKQTIEEERLKSQIETLIGILKKCPYSKEFSITKLPADEMIKISEKVCGIRRTTYSFGDILSASPEVSVLLTYYRNNVAHVFTIPSLIARCVRFFQKTTHMEVISYCSALYPYLKAEHFLPWNSREFEYLCGQLISTLEELGLILITDDQISAPAPMADGYIKLTDLGDIVEPALERYYLASALLESGSITSRSRAEAAASTIAAQLCVIYGIDSPEFFDQSLFTNFLGVLQKEERLNIAGDELDADISLTKVTRTVERLLDTDVAYNALQAVEQANKISQNSLN